MSMEPGPGAQRPRNCAGDVEAELCDHEGCSSPGRRVQLRAQCLVCSILGAQFEHLCRPATQSCKRTVRAANECEETVSAAQLKKLVLRRPLNVVTDRLLQIR